MWKALGSNSHYPSFPISVLQLYHKKTSAELETSGSFLRLKTKQTNKQRQKKKKKGSHGYVLRSMIALNSPVQERACQNSW